MCEEVQVCGHTIRKTRKNMGGAGGDWYDREEGNKKNTRKNVLYSENTVYILDIYHTW